MTDIEQRAAAKKFAEEWKDRGYEKGETHVFWVSLLRNVLGVKDAESYINFESQVSLAHTAFIDAYIPSTRVMIEQKSVDVNLTKAFKQSDGSMLTPFEQAKRYSDELELSKKPRYIVVCNFKEFHVHDMEHPHDKPEVIKLADLPKEYYRLTFLVDTRKAHLKREMELSIKAGEVVGKIYDAILKKYHDPTAESTLKSLNVLCVRLVFCLFAEDAGVFGLKNQFHDYLARFEPRDLRKALIELFKVLDTLESERDPYLDADLAAFPYVGGGLFADADIEIPQFDEDIKNLILERASDDFNWSEISPTIFGAVFESTLNPETRRSGGMHYTSIENIHKVIGPLFLEDLTRRVDEVLGDNGGVNKKRRAQLLALQDEIASLKFLDPACGSGNFLTETYISLRLLENRIIAALQGSQSELDLGDVIKVSINQFSGIEINDFAVTVAKTALWIAESQMMRKTEDIVHRSLDFLPLKSYANIVEGNALRIDWGEEVRVMSSSSRKDDKNSTLPLQLETPTKPYNYIMGNPPFVGYSNQSAEQKADMLSIFVDEKGKPYKTAGKLDYVCAWYRKAADYVLTAKDAKNTKVAFVSTNSICQGESVAAFWKPLFEMGLAIDFAWRTFRWDSEAHLKAHVHCVIVGFHVGGENLTHVRFRPQSGEKETSRTSRTSRELKKIYDGDKVIEAEHINGYLMDGPDVWIESRTKPICDVPVMTTGNRPADGGHLIIEREDYEQFQKCEPEALGYIKKFIGSAEFINNKPRYCLWLKNVSPAVLRKMPLVMQRIEACKADRLAAPDPGRRKLANTPTLFRETNNPHSAVVVPKVSSEKREYVPIGLIDAETIASDLVFLIPSATLYHFGVLTSSVHMAWMRTVCGRLEMRYRYSANIVYNNFPWPEVGERGDSEKTPNLQNSQSPSNESNHSESLRQKIESTAQAILDARALYPDSSLADLYDPLTMPIELRKAHAANDAAVMKAYGYAPTMTEPEIVADLMTRYQKLTMV